MHLRPATAEDRPLLDSALVAACNWSGEVRVTREQVAGDRTLRGYVDGWLRAGDAGVVAEDATGRPVGVAWARAFAADEPGYGFIAEDVPELSMAVLPDSRGQGVGAALLAAVVEQGRRLGWARLSLSVEDGNPARRLYERAGFRTVGRSGGSDTMVLDLEPEQADV